MGAVYRRIPRSRSDVRLADKHVELNVGKSSESIVVTRAGLNRTRESRRANCVSGAKTARSVQAGLRCAADNKTSHGKGSESRWGSQSMWNLPESRQTSRAFPAETVKHLRLDLGRRTGRAVPNHGAQADVPIAPS